MSLATYGVLKVRALDRKIDPETDPSPHYQVLVGDGEKKHRIAINVKSQESPSELLYLVNDAFQHPILNQLMDLSLGFHKLEHQPGGVALDFIRGNLFHPEDMKPLPPDVPGPGNDLKELIDLYIQRAIQAEDALLYAFGAPWGPEPTPDKYFGFRPGSGIHDIHMNQGSVGKFQKDNGVYQDGGLLLHFPSRNQWVGIFLAFQSQCFHTDDKMGDAIKAVCEKPPVEAAVRILAALVNPLGTDPGKESVTLMNVSPEAVNLRGWALADKQKHKYPIQDIHLKPGSVVTLPLSGADVQLSNEGGIITLLNVQGIKVDGVSYTKEQAQKQGWTVVF
jgi:uncharacterized protein YukJ